MRTRPGAYPAPHSLTNNKNCSKF